MSRSSVRAALRSPRWRAKWCSTSRSSSRSSWGSSSVATDTTWLAYQGWRDRGTGSVRKMRERAEDDDPAPRQHGQRPAAASRAGRPQDEGRLAPSAMRIMSGVIRRFEGSPSRRRRPSTTVSAGCRARPATTGPDETNRIGEEDGIAGVEIGRRKRRLEKPRGRAPAPRPSPRPRTIAVEAAVGRGAASADFRPSGRRRWRWCVHATWPSRLRIRASSTSHLRRLARGQNIVEIGERLDARQCRALIARCRRRRRAWRAGRSRRGPMAAPSRGASACGTLRPAAKGPRAPVRASPSSEGSRAGRADLRANLVLQAVDLGRRRHACRSRARAPRAARRGGPPARRHGAAGHGVEDAIAEEKAAVGPPAEGRAGIEGALKRSAKLTARVPGKRQSGPCHAT